MHTIIEESTGKVLFSKFNSNVVEGQVAIEQVFSGEIPEGQELFFNFETENFELR
jgi:hypothetical protein